MNNFNDVGTFHQKFDLDNVTYQGVGPRHGVGNDLLEFRRKFMQEELDEFTAAMERGDDVEMFDALLDLAYVVFGTAHLLGYPWQTGWDEVQRSNMEKERAAADGSNSKRLSAFDVVKPEGWTPPNLKGILKSFGFDV